MATNNEPNYKEILLTVLAEPDYLRLDYWQKQQRESGYNEMGFYKKIKDALEYYYNLIEDKIIEKESLGIPTNDYKIPLLLETDLKIKGELGRNEIQLLNTELKKYFATCLSFEQKVTYYKVAKYNIPFLWLYDTVFTVCEWVKPISESIEPVKYIEYFFTEIDFDKIEFNITKGEAKKYFNAIYYGLEQLLKADISKAIQNYQNNISNLTKQQIQETQIQLIELIGNLKRQTRTNEAGISFTHRYNLLYKSIEAKKTFLNIDYQIFIAHFNETISNDLLSSFEIINETFKEIAPLIQDKTTNSQPNKEQKIERKNESVINVFCKLMPLEIPIEHFKVFVKTKSKNGNLFLTNEQLNSFIERAFEGNNKIEKQTLNCTNREKLFLVKRFYQFYTLVVSDYEKTTQCKEKYIKLLTDNFTNWDFENIKDNFTNKVKRDW